MVKVIELMRILPRTRDSSPQPPRKSAAAESGSGSSLVSSQPWSPALLLRRYFVKYLPEFKIQHVQEGVKKKLGNEPVCSMGTWGTDLECGMAAFTFLYES